MEVCHWRQRRMPWMTLQGGSIKAVTSFLSRLPGAAGEVLQGDLWPLVSIPAFVFWNCSRAWRVEGQWSPHQSDPCKQSRSTPFAWTEEDYKIYAANLFENNFINPLDISDVAWDDGYLFQYDRSKKEKMEGVERLCLDSMSDPSSDWLL